jgi:uncharacterized protein DUF3617
MHKALIAAALTLAAPVAFAQDISPGLWEIVMVTRVPADSGFQPPEAKITQCITAQAAKDPGALFSQMGNPGASDCRYQDRNYQGNTFTFSMTCSGMYKLRTSGRVQFTRDTMEGNVSAVANIGDKDVETQNKLSAHLVGGC